MFNYLRTEGYYKMDPREKARTKFHFHRPGVDAFNTAKIGQGKNQKPQVTFVFYLLFTPLFLKGPSHEMDLDFDDLHGQF
jgi:hypothetical protein